ncbi:protein phosphatase domain containing protein [Entamoeba histolytica HM-1:IMSS-B]|uniref:Protein phosphatase domain-containing protein n=6 Tax=Entamoeba histolytica TaxID=5759 RepID=C4LVR2_ENTH1|nr:protein phosphatase domain-containing protein [Entamoeba histolytica HM-1:IMSS]EMD49365.1 protein phosphatase domain containing protein [Entamoeba histolytica KU27]EMH77508.1 protein phosphatase domain containing protein [Entamoeba histolytica HM-1:IMSS-B]EMS12028.1 protein phosphatase domain containing protein [Entamoeba histolytica HM-3:IMSS]ENY64265.1 protein phosphatase domain containing protein [Entamoeba histolytica HM-1:IMSS-A]GAT92767.1 protein phosphatase domain-containing protein |eukprot:XP_656426.1 protein phosphatase domain-containing protein [Entamoeba histolytica HM-1:IMSS]
MSSEGSSSNNNFDDYDDSTDSSEEEFIRQQAEKAKVHLPRKSSTILIEKGKTAQLLADNNIDHTEYDSDDEDLNCSDLSVYETSTQCTSAVAHTSGRRNYNEDRICVATNIEGADLFAVFDGHNGHEAATLCRNKLKQVYGSCHGNINDTFQSLNDIVSKETTAGCTATIVAVKQNSIEVGNCGDSPAYVIRKDKSIEKITYDHKATDPKEEEMIVKNGGVVMNLFGTKRVNGQIMVTRSIGDRSLHPPMTSIPTTKIISKEDIISICVMSDGVTDALTDLEIHDIMTNGQPIEIRAQTIRNQAYKEGSKDNICVVVVDL